MLLLKASAVCLSAIIIIIIAARRGSASCPSPTCTGRCPPTFNRIGNACYRVVNPFTLGESWAKNQAACQAMGGELAAPHSSEENQLLQTMVPERVNLWIGCRDEAGDGEWVCEGQEKSDTYSNWIPSQPGFPDQTSGPYFTCAVQENGYPEPYTGVWQTQPCHAGFRAVCVYRLRGLRQHCFASSNNPQFTNWCLIDHVIREFVTKTVASCTSACITESGCRSFNVIIKEQGQKLCQLNDATTFDDVYKFQRVSSSCTYYSEYFTACMNSN